MKTLIIFYSLSGNTKAYAEKKAKELGADIEEIIAEKKPSMLSALFFGVSKASKRQKIPTKPLRAQVIDYDKVIIMSPIWASNPAPAINNIFDLLPSGKKVELIMISAGGGSKKSAEGTKALVTARGCEVISYIDVKIKRNKDGVVCQRLK